MPNRSAQRCLHSASLSLSMGVRILGPLPLPLQPHGTLEEPGSRCHVQVPAARLNLPALSPRPPLGPLLGPDQGPHSHPLRGRPLPVRHPAAQHLPGRAPPLLLPLPVQWPPEPQPVRQWESVRQPPGHLDWKGGSALARSEDGGGAGREGVWDTANQLHRVCAFQGTERWTSKSSLLQVLISIQGTVGRRGWRARSLWLWPL